MESSFGYSSGGELTLTEYGAKYFLSWLLYRGLVKKIPESAHPLMKRIILGSGPTKSDLPELPDAEVQQAVDEVIAVNEIKLS